MTFIKKTVFIILGIVIAESVASEKFVILEN